MLLVPPFLAWLIQGAVGPALVGLPVSWGTTELAEAAAKWFRRLRRSDGLSRMVLATLGTELTLRNDEFAGIRSLLQQESTWAELGHGTVEDLAGQIAACLPDRDGADAQAAGRVIARGLLEFATRDLEPEWFQKVLFARLDRLQSDQASAVDSVLIGLHADLAAQLAAKDTTDAERADELADRLSKVLDRLPPGTADRGEVALYLAKLARWLNIDPWPRDARFGGPVLTPAQIERKLRIRSGPGTQERFADADELGRLCIRLAVLGGPGSGKTWFARRTARLCAEAALRALADGAHLDEIELPLYTTCARLAAAPASDDIRHAIVSSALGYLPDLGGARISAAIRALFEERDAGTLLVADSLDEANGAEDRVVQADSLPSTWRILLTSRPGSWNEQLNVGGGEEELRQVGYLLPLRYPDDVEPFITRWFDGNPQWAANLITQIRDRPALQEAGTVPLILAFYCIVGGSQPLPDNRAELYTKVIRRMITSRWRGGAVRDPDPETCLRMLRDWAWSAASRDPLSGLGTWTDEFSTERPVLARDDQDALNNVAVPFSLPDLDTGLTRRRFVHMSVREHMVAEYIAAEMNPETAAEELLAHLWYDPNWEHAGPAALARHPDRDRLLRDLLRRATGVAGFPKELASVDGCWEIRRFLSRVALESKPGEWSPHAAALIDRARIDLYEAGDRAHLAQVAAGWTMSNAAIGGMLLTELATADTHAATALASTMARLDLAPDDRGSLRRGLFTQLAATADSDRAALLARTLSRFVPGEAERGEVIDALVALLARERESRRARDLCAAAILVANDPRDRTDLRATMLDLLAESAQLRQAARLAEALAQMEPTARDQDRARVLLSGLLDEETTGVWAGLGGQALAALMPSPQEQARANDKLLALLAREPVSGGAQELADAICGLAADPVIRADARVQVIGFLTQERFADRSALLAQTVTALAVTREEREQAFQVIFPMLGEETRTDRIRLYVRTLATLAANYEHRSRILGITLDLLSREDDVERAVELARTATILGLTMQARAAVRDRLLALLATEHNATKARTLTEAVAALGSTAAEQGKLFDALIGLLEVATDNQRALLLAGALQPLRLPPEGRARIRNVLIARLAEESGATLAGALADAISGFGPTGHDLARIRRVLLGLLAGDGTSRPLYGVDSRVQVLARLGMTEQDRAEARSVILGLLKNTSNAGDALSGVEALAVLDPTARQKSEVRREIIRLLEHDQSGISARLAQALLVLESSERDREQVRSLMIRKLEITFDSPNAGAVSDRNGGYGAGKGSGEMSAMDAFELLAKFAVTAEERAQARTAVSGLLESVRARSPISLESLEGQMPPRLRALQNEIIALRHGLGMLEEEEAPGREAITGKLRNSPLPPETFQLVASLARMNQSDEDKALMREALTRLLVRGENSSVSGVVDLLARLNPTAGDLEGARSWQVPPDPQMLAEVRKNSTLQSWLAVAPTL
jgi:hypothetical protein